MTNFKKYVEDQKRLSSNEEIMEEALKEWDSDTLDYVWRKLKRLCEDRKIFCEDKLENTFVYTSSNACAMLSPAGHDVFTISEKKIKAIVAIKNYENEIVPVVLFESDSYQRLDGLIHEQTPKIRIFEHNIELYKIQNTEREKLMKILPEINNKIFNVKIDRYLESNGFYENIKYSTLEITSRNKKLNYETSTIASFYDVKDYLVQTDPCKPTRRINTEKMIAEIKETIEESNKHIAKLENELKNSNEILRLAEELGEKVEKMKRSISGDFKEVFNYDLPKCFRN